MRRRPTFLAWPVRRPLACHQGILEDVAFEFVLLVFNEPSDFDPMIKGELAPRVQGDQEGSLLSYWLGRGRWDGRRILHIHLRKGGRYKFISRGLFREAGGPRSLAKHMGNRLAVTVVTTLCGHRSHSVPFAVLNDLLVFLELPMPNAPTLITDDGIDSSCRADRHCEESALPFWEKSTTIAPRAIFSDLPAAKPWGLRSQRILR